MYFGACLITLLCMHHGFSITAFCAFYRRLLESQHNLTRTSSLIHQLTILTHQDMLPAFKSQAFGTLFIKQTPCTYLQQFQ